MAVEKALEIELLFRILAPPVMVVVVDATVVPLSVRVLSQLNSLSPGKEACFGGMDGLVGVGNIH
jgi:hypothetical protein